MCMYMCVGMCTAFAYFENSFCVIIGFFICRILIATGEEMSRQYLHVE